MSANIAATLPAMAARRPHALAIACPQGRDSAGRRAWTHYTYAQLDQDSDIIAAGLRQYGIDRGTRTVVMVKPGLDLFALTFALFKLGAPPVMVDPGMGIQNLKACLDEARPDAFIGIPAAQAARLLLGWSSRTIRKVVTVGQPFFWGGTTLKALREVGRRVGEFEMALTEPEETAAILFTSGSTGVPKGAVYRHEVFLTQVEMIRDMYRIQPGEIDLPTFPLFALFDPALGMTSIIPDMDFTRPARVNPLHIIEAVEGWGVTNMFGSPALLNTLGRYAEAHQTRLPTLRRVISAGAPVAPEVMERILGMMEEGEIHTPYGATESLPVASISASEVLSETRQRTEAGLGTCVGRPADGVDVRIIRITDQPIDRWDTQLEVPPGRIGEITVGGPMVTWEYHNRPEQTGLAKIRDGDRVLHRMGDVGYFDSKGRLWYCGRKSHRVETDSGVLFTDPCEAPFNNHPEVFRSALVGVKKGGKTRPVIIVELEKGVKADRGKLTAELREIAARHRHTESIETFLFHGAFPVDVRHNAKIGREQLAVWAADQLRGRR